MKRKILLVLLSIAVLLTSAACNQNPTGTSSSKASESSVSNSDVNNDPFLKSDTEIVLKQGRDSANPAGEGWILDDNIITDVIHEVLNVKIEDDWELTGDEYTQKVQLVIATNDLPDIMVISSMSILREMFNKDLIEDLTAASAVFSDRLKDDFSSYANNRNLESVTFEGKLAAIPNTNIGGQHEILWVRRDWIEELGMEMPTSLDEVIDLARAFIEQDPDGNGSDDTIGIPLLSDLFGVHNTLYTVDPILSIYHSYPRQFLDDGNGGIVYGSNTNETKEALSKIADLVKDGTISVDPDMGDVLVGNQCGIFFGPWWSVWSHLWGARTNNRYADWIPIAAPLNDDNELVDVYQEPNTQYLIVKKGYEYPEAAVRALNVIYGLYNRDLDIPELAPYATVAEEMPQNFTAWPIPLQLEREDILYQQSKRMQAALDEGSDDPLFPNEKRVYENLVNYFNDKIQCSTTDWAETTAKLMGTREAYKYFKGIEPLIYYLTPEMEEIYEPLFELEEDTFAKIVTGEAPIDSFDQYVTQWSDMGGDDLMELIEQSVG